MKTTKKAFTLAEVLIALSITGIVTAFIIPQTVTSIQKQQAGLKLAKTVKQIELGCKNYIEYSNEQNNDSHYTTIAQIPDFSMEKLVSFIGLVRDESDVKIKTNDYVSMNSSILPTAYAARDPIDIGSVGTGTGTGKGKYIESLRCNSLLIETVDEDCSEKPDVGYTTELELNPCIGNFFPRPVECGLNLGMVDDPVVTDTTRYLYKTTKGNVNVLFGKALDTTVTGPNESLSSVHIDINGYAHKPNMYGKDTFIFSLNNSGQMVPYGINKYKDDCSDTKITNGKACTARVVAEGYKINY